MQVSKSLFPFLEDWSIYILKKKDYRKVKMLLNSDLHQVLLSPSDKTLNSVSECLFPRYGRGRGQQKGFIALLW